MPGQNFPEKYRDTHVLSTKEGRYPIARVDGGSLGGAGLFSGAFHPRRRTDSAAPWTDDERHKSSELCLHQGGAISDRPRGCEEHEGREALLMHSPSTTADRFRRSLVNWRMIRSCEPYSRIVRSGPPGKSRQDMPQPLQATAKACFLLDWFGSHALSATTCCNHPDHCPPIVIHHQGPCHRCHILSGARDRRSERMDGPMDPKGFCS